MDIIEETMEVQAAELTENCSSDAQKSEDFDEGNTFVSNSTCKSFFYNRRCSLRPRKLSQMDKKVTLEDFIHSPKKKRKTVSLKEVQSIFEEPIVNKDNGILIGLKHTSRYLSFSQFVSKARKNKRKMKKLKISKTPDKKKKKKALSLTDVEGKMTQLGI